MIWSTQWSFTVKQLKQILSVRYAQGCSSLSVCFLIRLWYNKRTVRPTEVIDLVHCIHLNSIHVRKMQHEWEVTANIIEHMINNSKESTAKKKWTLNLLNLYKLVSVDDKLEMKVHTMKMWAFNAEFFHNVHKDLWLSPHDHNFEQQSFFFWSNHFGP